MLFEDHFMRMINQAIAALLKIMGLRQAGQYEQAQQEIDQTLEGLLGLKADLIRRLDDEALLRAVTLNEQVDMRRLEIISDLFREQGEVYVAQGKMAESRESFRRALFGYLETGLASESGQMDPELDQKITSLVSALKVESLSEDTLWALFCYSEQVREYAQAERVLDDLAGRQGVFADLQPEIIAFYERLSGLSPQELTRSGLSRELVVEKLAQAKGEIGTDS
jgi:tetratricopeptide (TPR) repeat protein